LQSDAAATLSTFLTYSNSSGKIFVQIANPINTGVYKLKVVATEPVSGLRNNDITFTLTLTCTTKLFKNTEVNVNNIVYTIPADLNSKPVILPLPVYQTDPKYCLLQPYSLVLVDANSGQLPSFISLNSSGVTILTNDPTITSQFEFKFIATEPRFNLVDKSVSFSVTFKCEISKISDVISSKTIPTSTIYVLRSAPVVYELPTFSWSPSNCK